MISRIEPNKTNEHILLPILLLVANVSLVFLFYAINEFFKIERGYFDEVGIVVANLEEESSALMFGLGILAIALLSVIPALKWKKSWLIVISILINLFALDLFI